jgi:hypothetical protein
MIQSKLYLEGDKDGRTVEFVYETESSIGWNSCFSKENNR